MSLARSFSVDDSTQAINVVDYSHHEIHSGSHFKAGFQDTTMSTDDTITLLFTTPDSTKEAHWVLTAQSTGAATVEVYEGTTTSADGTAVTAWNRNRNSSTTATVVVTHTPTVTSDGTKFATKWIGSDGKFTESGGSTRGDSEIILKQNTKYLVRLTARSDTIMCAIGGDWYEHTDKTQG